MITLKPNQQECLSKTGGCQDFQKESFCIAAQNLKREILRRFKSTVILKQPQASSLSALRLKISTEGFHELKSTARTFTPWRPKVVKRLSSLETCTQCREGDIEKPVVETKSTQPLTQSFQCCCFPLGQLLFLKEETRKY